MVCRKCGYERWDGKSVHLFAGRESAGVNCFGPMPDIPSRKLDTAMAEIKADMQEVAKKAGKALVSEALHAKEIQKALDTGATHNAKLTRADRLRIELEKLEASGALIRGAQLPAAQRAGSPLARRKRGRPKKPS